MVDHAREPSLGEVSEDLRELKALVERGFRDLTTTYVRADVYAAQQDALKARLEAAELRNKATEERQTWVARTAVTALILPLLVGVVIFVILNSTR